MPTISHYTKFEFKQISHMKKYILPLCIAASALTLSCSNDDEATPPNGGNSIAASQIDATLKTGVAQNYANIVAASYQDAITEAQKLKTAIDNFASNPTDQGLSDCKNAWLAARIPYGQTEAYRFYDGPIDDANGPEGALNAWPLDENYIDYTRDAADDGIINDPDYQLSKEQLIRTNTENISEESEDSTGTFIVTGYHAIEFMLWGQDNLDVSNGQPGNRPLSDFTTRDNYQRRLDFLKLVAEILIDDLNSVYNQWKEGGAYRTSFIANPDDAIKNMITGIGELSGPELGGERMRVALRVAENPNPEEGGANLGQEDEHSCFSDNTHNDIILNFEGCVNVLRGTYVRIDGSTISGPSLLDVLTASNASRATAINDKATEALASTKEIPAPFDLALKNNPGSIQNSIDLLDSFSALAADAKLGLGLIDQE